MIRLNFQADAQAIRARATLAAALLGSVALSPCSWAQADAPAAPAAPGAATLPAPPWDKLRAAYDYQATLPDADYRLEHIALLDGEGKAVPGLFLRPKPAGTYPVVLLLHGLTSDKETMIQAFGRPLAALGFACLALDAREHGERKSPGATLDLGSLLAPGAAPQNGNGAAGATQAGARFGAVMRGTVGDYRRALDYLELRRDVDASRIGLLGYSMGAMMGAIVAGVDQRVKAAVLEVGGDPIKPLVVGVPEILRGEVEAISPSNYVGRIAPRPLLLINARADQIMSEAAARRLQQAAHEPTQIVWAEGGHILAPQDAARGIAFLSQTLQAPAAAASPSASSAQPTK